jgi:hypothetical protein
MGPRVSARVSRSTPFTRESASQNAGPLRANGVGTGDDDRDGDDEGRRRVTTRRRVGDGAKK